MHTSFLGESLANIGNVLETSWVIKPLVAKDSKCLCHLCNPAALSLLHLQPWHRPSLARLTICGRICTAPLWYSYYEIIGHEINDGTRSVGHDLKEYRLAWITSVKKRVEAHHDTPYRRLLRRSPREEADSQIWWACIKNVTAVFKWCKSRKSWLGTEQRHGWVSFGTARRRLKVAPNNGCSSYHSK